MNYPATVDGLRRLYDCRDITPNSDPNTIEQAVVSMQRGLQRHACVQHAYVWLIRRTSPPADLTCDRCSTPFVGRLDRSENAVKEGAQCGKPPFHHTPICDGCFATWMVDDDELRADADGVPSHQCVT